jgi:hypothetical protein
MNEARDALAEALVVYDRGRPASVTLTMTPEEAQAVFDRLYVYDTDPGYMARYAITRRLLESGAVAVETRG